MSVTSLTSRLQWDRVRSVVNLSERQRRFLARAVLIAVGIRVGLLLGGYVIGYIIIGREVTPAEDIIRETFNRWDAPHYQTIAENGYVSEGPDRVLIAFFPLYPMAIRLTHYVIPDYFLAAMFVSFVCNVAALYLIQAMIAGDGGDEGEADRGAWYTSLFPTAYFFALPYTESMFLALVLGSFVSARRKRWAWSGFFGMLACATRMQGLVLVPALAVEALLSERWKSPFRAFWLAMVPLGVVFYLGINWVVLDDPFAFLDIQRDHWGQRSLWPWEGFRNTFEGVRDSPSGSFRTSVLEFALATIVVTAVILAAGTRHLKASYLVFGWVSLLFMMSLAFPISLPRYVLGIFPVFLVLAWLGRNPGVHQLIFTSSAVLMGVLFTIYATRWGF
jgi:Gpi18-like mannosyltransferase